jgi:hypothetical protein
VALTRIGTAVLVLTMASAGSLAPAATGSAASISKLPPGPRGGGTSRLGPGTTIHLASSQNPPVTRAPTSPVRRPLAQPSRVTQSKGLTATSSTPSAPETSLPPLWTPPATPPAPTDLAVFESTPLGALATNENTSPTDEPSVSANGDDVFYTGNFYAAVSTNAGKTFSYIDPATDFPTAFFGFCCDQRTIYVPGWDFTAWALLYLPDPSNNNEVRLAVARGANGLASNTWTYWDITTADAEITQPGVSLDYPQLAYDSTNLFLTANVLNPSTPGNPGGSIYTSVVFRCPLSALASQSGGTLPCDNFWVGSDTFTPVDGATTTMYWASHADNATLLVYAWPDGLDWTNVTATPVSHSAFIGSGYSCQSPDATDMCATDEWTVRGGWLAGGVLGFFWDAAQGTDGLGTFPFPYEHVVEIDEGSMSLIDEPIIWSSQNAWAYGGVAVNGVGELGATVAYAGGNSMPGSALMVRDGVSAGAWQPLNVAEGTNGRLGNGWGDFLTARTYGGDSATWLAGTFTLQGQCSNTWGACSSVQPQFVWFGRQSNIPCVLVPPRQPSGPVPTPVGATRRAFLPFFSSGGCTS